LAVEGAARNLHPIVRHEVRRITGEVELARRADRDVVRVAAAAGAGGYPGADDPVQKYADLPIGAEGKQAVIRAQSALYLLPESADVSLNTDLVFMVFMQMANWRGSTLL